MKNKRFVFVDGSSLLFRAFYAIPHLTTQDGLATNAVYGFLSMFFSMMDEYNPDYLLIAFDESGPTFRTEMYDAYKGQREKAPDELAQQFGIIREILKAMNVREISLPTYEADDIIGTMAKQAAKEDLEVLLFTGDRDFYQLVDENIDVLLTRKGISNLERVNLAFIEEEYGLEPKDLIEVKGLMGDSSDNIPGVPGVGEKTALRFIKKYKTIENLYEHIDDISGKKTKENLINNKETAFLSRDLGRIHLEVPLELSIEDCLVKEADEEALRVLYDRYNFTSFAERLGQDDLTKEEDFAYSFLEEAELKALVENFEGEEFVFDFFYDEDIYTQHQPLYFACLMDGKAHILELKEGQSLAFLEDLLQGDQVRKVSYDMKKNLYYLLGQNIKLEKPFLDISVMEYLIDPAKNDYLIEVSASEHLGRQVNSLESYVGKGAKKKSLRELEKEDLGSYISMVLTISQALIKPLEEEIENRSMHQLYHEVELPLVQVLASMEYEGVSVDEEILADLGQTFSEELEDLEKEIHGYAGSDFNINSPKQLGVVLFETLGLPVIRKTKTGYSTAQDVLEKLQGSHDIIDAIMRYRSLAKLKSTYIDGLKDLIQEDGKIHTTFLQSNTTTGRISSREPNLQNIPIRTEEGRWIRKAFVPRGDHVFVDADYSQIELRVLAHLSEDQAMIEAFKEGQDIHAETAAQVFHLPLDQVSARQRDEAKAVNFGIVYGVSDYGLSQNLGITRKEAKTYIESYFDHYQGIHQYMEEIVEQAKKEGYVETILHRRRYIPELKSSNFNVRSFGERVALNTPIQGSAADIIKLAMVRVYNELEKRGLKSKLVLQIHDELMIETVEDEVDQVKKLLREIMEDAFQLAVPLTVDLTVQKSWYE